MIRRDLKTLTRLAAMDDFANEADVQHYFISPLITLLGYEVPKEAPSEKQLPFVVIRAGRARSDLKRPDFLLRVNGRALAVIEAKGPREKLSDDAIEQALSYARHDEVRAPLTMLTNGRRILVLESDTRYVQLDITQKQLVKEYRRLHLLLSKETLGSVVNGHLRVEEELGRGAFGTVYKAWNLHLGRAEAVKVYDFAADDRARKRARLRQGIVAHAGLEHPNIATLYGTLQFGSELALRMRYVDGQPLDKWVKSAKPSLRERVLLLAQAARAIAFAHERGVVHRDLKPSNILVTGTAGNWSPVIVDFDTAVTTGQSTLTTSGDEIGSYGYLDPDMLDPRSRKKRDPRSDIYSLGRILEFLLTGAHPRSSLTSRDLDERVRRGARGATDRERTLLISILHAAVADVREGRYESAEAFASDLVAVFEVPAAGAESAEDYARQVFSALDEIVAAGQMPLSWQNLTSMHRPSEFGRYSLLPRFGELNALYDTEAYSFYIGPVIGEPDEFARFARSRELRELRRVFGKALRLDPPISEEDGSANLVYRYVEHFRDSPPQLAARFAGDLRKFLEVLDPAHAAAATVTAPAQPPPRDRIAEFDEWPARSFGSRQEFKKLARELRDAGELADALLPFVHLLWPEARRTPELAADGIDIAVGSPMAVAIQCASGGIAAAQRMAEAFRRSKHRVRDYLVVINREEETPAARRALAPSFERIVAEGKGERATLWNHRDHLVYAGFEIMLQRVLRAIERWNVATFEEQAQIERTLGATPIREVPFAREEIRIDAAAMHGRVAAAEEVGDIVEELLSDERRRVRVVLGTAGFGKTTAVMRAAREYGLQWLLIPAAKIRRDAANAQSLFETALDLDVVLEGAATPGERVTWQRIAGPAVKYLTQYRSGVGVIVDALDESPVIGRSYTLQTFFNFFRRAVVPVIVTMRTEFWEGRRGDFATGRSAVESTVQTLEIFELRPWTDRQIVRAARMRLAETGDTDARLRISAFIRDIESGAYEQLYGDIPRTPLFLRFILDVLDTLDPRRFDRTTLFRHWAEAKIARDVEHPLRKGGSRLPIRHGVVTTRETIDIAFEAMTEAAACMTEVRDGAVELLPECSFEAVRTAMGKRAPSSAEALALNSLLILTAGHEPRLRFAHRLFQEFFLARAAGRFGGAALPPTVRTWLSSGPPHAIMPGA
ncbi:MAG TPA: protein kinase [Thermoanaerobaculia bacterium]